MSTTQERMLGKKHDKQCDCNIKKHISGLEQKCNRHYGVKRARSREKRAWKHEHTL